MQAAPASRARARRQALKISLVYLVFGVLWIALSDAALELSVAPEHITRFQTYKGWAFVTFTAALVFWMVWRQLAVNDALGAERERQSRRLEQTNLRLREQEGLLDVVVNSSPAMVWMSGPDRGRSFFNATWLRFTGREAAREMGTGWMEGVHADDRERCRRILAEVFDARAALALEYRLRRHDGEYRWIFDEGTPRFDAAGRFCGYVGSSLDITERLLAQRALAESEAALARAQAVARVGSWRMDLAGATFDWSAESYRIHGVPLVRDGGANGRGVHPPATLPPEGDGPALGRPGGGAAPPLGQPVTLELVLSRVHPADRTRVQRAWQDIRDGRASDLEHRLVCDDQTKWVRLLAQLEFDGAGHAVAANGTVQDITDQRLAEDALRDSEERFRATFEQAAVGIAMVSPDGRWLRVNQRFCDIAGYRRDELLALGFQDITHPDDLAADVEAARRVLAGEIDRYSLERRYLRPDGSSVWVNLTVSLVRTHDGRPKYFIVVAEDIGARKRAEQELALGEERYRYLFERNPLPMWVYDKETLRFLEVNVAAVEHYGYPRERFLAMTLRDIRPPQDVQAMEAAAHARGDRAYGGQWRHLRHDGSVIDVTIWSKPIEFAGRAARLVLAEDITLGKRAQEARSAAEARYRVLMDLLPYGVQENDTEGRVVYANPALERLQGSGPGGSVGRHIWDFLADEEERPRLRAYLAHLVADQPPPQTYYGRNRRPDGSTVDVQVDWTYDRADDGRVRGFVSVISDITGHRQAEARLRHLSQQLMQVQEEERRALARELHDEVGQALTALKLSLHAIRRSMSEPATLARLADCIEITENTIAQIRDRALDLRPSVLDDLGLTAALEWFLRRQEERSGCRFVLRAEPLVRRPRPGVEIAAFRLVQEAVNNALRHGHASRVDVAMTSDEAMLQLTVRDDGRGFRVEQAMRRSRAGGGIGLPGMRERVEVLGGRFEVRSRPGKGAEVTATFPLEMEEGDGGYFGVVGG